MATFTIWSKQCPFGVTMFLIRTNILLLVLLVLKHDLVSDIDRPSVDKVYMLLENRIESSLMLSIGSLKAPIPYYSYLSSSRQKKKIESISKYLILNGLGVHDHKVAMGELKTRCHIWCKWQYHGSRAGYQSINDILRKVLNIIISQLSPNKLIQQSQSPWSDRPWNCSPQPGRQLAMLEQSSPDILSRYCLRFLYIAVCYDRIENSCQKRNGF